MQERLDKTAQELEQAENQNGFLGGAWSGFKNLTGIGDSSDKVREQQEAEKKLLLRFNSDISHRAEIFKELTGQDYNQENLEKFINNEVKLKSEIALQDAGHDSATGAVSGILAPITGGMGGAVGKTVATKLGVQAVKQVGKEIVGEAADTTVKQGLKTMLTNPTGYEYLGARLLNGGLHWARKWQVTVQWAVHWIMLFEPHMTAEALKMSVMPQ